MRILLCDDDPTILTQLKKYITEYFNAADLSLPQFDSYDSGDRLLADNPHAELAFLDVEMPGVSGINVGAQLKKTNPYIKIFIVTAFPDYLDEAMKFQVFRYLSKPLDKNRLFRNLKDALYQLSTESREYAIETPQGVIVCHADEIICVEAIQRKILVHTTQGVLISTKKLDYWYHELTLPRFFVTHRSFIVNMSFIRSILKDKILLQYESLQIEAYLTKRKRSALLDSYLLFLEGSR